MYICVNCEPGHDSFIYSDVLYVLLRENNYFWDIFLVLVNEDIPAYNLILRANIFLCGNKSKLIFMLAINNGR